MVRNPAGVVSSPLRSPRAEWVWPSLPLALYRCRPRARPPRRKPRQNYKTGEAASVGIGRAAFKSAPRPLCRKRAGGTRQVTAGVLNSAARLGLFSGRRSDTTVGAEIPGKLWRVKVGTRRTWTREEMPGVSLPVCRFTGLSFP